ncbi:MULTISPECIES: hypothetical protein [Halorussus]|uniref:hypothetical protein n=1 Tax=Halorussus TaxID=1070314 RepID=UPI0020A107D5|nr:hypothetical protein [Halorussus vallis]USZ77429.1 hypothetical protein NGM07_08875 [Halorussus vallis]
MHRVKIRRLSGTKDHLTAGITIPKAILEHNGLVDGGELTDDYHVFVSYDHEEGVLKVPIPNVGDNRTANSSEEALVERERERKLSPGERDVLGDQATASSMEGD